MHVSNKLAAVVVEERPERGVMTGKRAIRSV